jgi:hypothetical protein
MTVPVVIRLRLLFSSLVVVILTTFTMGPFPVFVSFVGAKPL